jgi:hypothetical protein
MHHTRLSARSLLLCVLLPSLLGLTAGCGKGSKLEVHHVKGIVKYNGKPMAGGGSILFLPVEGGSGKEASGFIAEDGTFQLTTYEQGDGAPEGEYKVVINQTTANEPDGGSDDGKAPAASQNVPEADHIPLIYADPSSTPLRKTVSQGGNEFEIDLQPQAGKAKRGA